MTSPATTWKPQALPLRPLTAVAKERVFYGGTGLLIAIVIWVPLALKTGMRLEKFVELDLPTGFEFINLLLLIGLGRLLAGDADAKKKQTDSRVTMMSVALVTMFVVALVSCFTAGFLGGGDAMWYCIVMLKRWATMMLMFAFARRFLHSRKQVVWLFYAMTLILTYASYNLLRESLDMGLGHEHFKNGMRFGGIFDYGGENDLAAFFAEFIFIPLALLKLETRRLAKWILRGAIFVIALGCMFCYSRGAWIGIVAGTFVYLVRRQGAKGLLVLLLLAVVIAPFLPHSVIDRWTMTEDDSGQLEASAASRVIVWNQGLQILKDNIILGVGFARFVEYTAHMELALDAHNQYLKLACELGIPGLVVFIFLILCCFGLTSKPRDQFEREIFIALSACMTAFVIVNFFGNRFVREPLTCYLWMFVGAVAWLRTWRQEPLPAADFVAQQASLTEAGFNRGRETAG